MFSLSTFRFSIQSLQIRDVVEPSYLLAYFGCLSSAYSNECVRMRRFVGACAGRICDKHVLKIKHCPLLRLSKK